MPKFGQRSVDDGDKVWEITWGDAVVGNVAGNNLGDEMGIDCIRFSHRSSPAFWSPNSSATVLHRDEIETKRSSVSPVPYFEVAVPRQMFKDILRLIAQLRAPPAA